jgi:hypothetical protein
VEEEMRGRVREREGEWGRDEVGGGRVEDGYPLRPEVAPEEEEWGKAEEEQDRVPLPDEEPTIEVEENTGWRNCEAQCLGPSSRSRWGRARPAG